MATVNTDGGRREVSRHVEQVVDAAQVARAVRLMMSATTTSTPSAPKRRAMAPPMLRTA